MSEKNETDQTNVQDASKDRVGDIIRKERITRRITVETIAKDLKLNVKYIKALEASEYEALPADPYIRVYFRSLAKYLSLDSEEILKKFYEERGMSPDHINKDTSSKIVISVKEKENKNNPTLIITIALIVALAGFSFFANKKGWISTPQSIQETADSVATTATAAADSINDSILDDSLFSGAPVQVADSSLLKTADSANKSDSKLETMKLKIEALSDSVWAQVFSDGQSWKSIILNGSPREFTAKDSFNVHIASNPNVKYYLNGKPLKVKGNGVVFFKVDTAGIPIPWGNTRWTNTFKGRL